MSRNLGVLLDDSGEFIINGKTLAIGDVTKQNQQTIILANKGEIKERPTLGVGISTYLDDDDPSLLLREIRINLREDGQKVRSCGFYNSKLVIDGGYENE